MAKFPPFLPLHNDRQLPEHHNEAQAHASESRYEKQIQSRREDDRVGGYLAGLG